MMKKIKNSALRRKTTERSDSREKNENKDGLVIRVLQEPWRKGQLPQDIGHISELFKEGVILYENGNLYIFTKITAIIADEIRHFATKSLLRLKLENIGSWLQVHEIVLFYKLNNSETQVLPYVSQTERIFRQLKEEISVPSFCVKLSDLFQEDDVHTTNLLSKTVNRQSYSKSSEHSTWKDTCSFSTRKISLKKTRKVVISNSGSLLATFPILLTTFPISRELAMSRNFPQQATEEQNEEGRSEYAFSSGLSLPFNAGHASGLAIGGNNMSRYPGYNVSTGNEISHVNTSRRYHVGSRYPDYVEYSDRLKTYARWTHRSPDPSTLSNAGFFYTNDGDLVRCFQCGIGLKDFSEGDDPLKEHVKHSGNCSYLVEMMGESTLTEWKRLLQAQDPEYNRQMQWNERHNISAVPYNYRHPEYQTLEARLGTFAHWPAHMRQRPEQLADAGLYYTGFEDQVRCFACDGGLRHWDPADDPWTEHCRWFPACPFAKEKKGDEYIALVQAAVALENEDESSRSPDQGLSGAMEHMTLRDPEFRAALNEHKSACLEMGYQLTDFNEAVDELRNRGTIKPTIEEIIDGIEVIKARKIEDSVKRARENETPVEENRRLKSYVICMTCGRNNVNALFLPCAHHRLCMECADHVTNCPVCEKYIRQKIRTYLV